MDAKTSRLNLGEKEDVYITSKYHVTNHLLTTEGEIMMIKLRSLVDTTLVKWLKLKLISNGINQHQVLDIMYWEGHYITSLVFLPKQNKTEQQKKSIIWTLSKETSDKPKSRNIVQNSWPSLFKNIRVVKDKGLRTLLH